MINPKRNSSSVVSVEINSVVQDHEAIYA